MKQKMVSYNNRRIVENREKSSLRQQCERQKTEQNRVKMRKTKGKMTKNGIRQGKFEKNKEKGKKRSIHNLKTYKIYSIISFSRAKKEPIKRSVYLYFKQEDKILYKRNLQSDKYNGYFKCYHNRDYPGKI